MDWAIVRQDLSLAALIQMKELSMTEAADTTTGGSGLVSIQVFHNQWAAHVLLSGF